MIEGISGEAAVVQADLKGLCISAASACHKGIMSPSHVVSALNIGTELALGSLRISAGRFNSQEQCKQAAELLTKIVRTLRAQEVKV